MLSMFFFFVDNKSKHFCDMNKAQLVTPTNVNYSEPPCVRGRNKYGS